MKDVRVGLVQMTCSASKPDNMAKAIQKTREAAALGAQIVVLQELFTSLYFCDLEEYSNFTLAEAIPGPSTETLGTVAKELGIVIVASLFENLVEATEKSTAPNPSSSDEGKRKMLDKKSSGVYNGK
jgi:N-carbamoylputrescine amidase